MEYLQRLPYYDKGSALHLVVFAGITAILATGCLVCEIDFSLFAQADPQ